MRVPWTARRSNQSILKEINPRISLEGMMLKLKLQYFGHLMRRVDSLEKTLSLYSFLSIIFNSILYLPAPDHHAPALCALVLLFQKGPPGPSQIAHLPSYSLTSSVQFSSVQSLSRVRLFATPRITARQVSLSITNSRGSLRCRPAISSSVVPFSSCPNPSQHQSLFQ